MGFFYLANFLDIQYTVPTSGHRIAAIMAAFQAAEGGSTPPARSKVKSSPSGELFTLELVCESRTGVKRSATP